MVEHWTTAARTIAEQTLGRMNNIFSSAESIGLAEYRLAKILEYARSIGNPDMPRKTYTITLRVDYNTQDKVEITTKLVRQAARRLSTQVNLIADKRKPQIAVESEDFFIGTEQIDLAVMDDEV